MFTLRKLGHALVLGLAFTAIDPSLIAFAKPKVPAKEVIEVTLSGRKNPKTALGNSVAKLLQKSQKLAEEDKFAEALVVLEEALGKAKTPYEIAKTNQIKASYLYNSEKYDEALVAARAAVAANGLDNIEHLQSKFFIAQLLTQSEKYDEAIKAFDDYASDAPKVKGADYILQAGNYYYQDKFKQAITFTDKAFATGDTPAKSWYQIRLNSFYQGEDYVGAAAYAKELMIKEPENRQWLSIAVSSYLSLDKNADALALLNTAKANNHLDSEELWTQLYQLYSNTDQFSEAGAAIEEGIAKGFLKSDAKRMSSLGQNYYMGAQAVEGKPEAKPMLDKAIEAFKRAIPLDAKSGEAELWLGQILLLDRDDAKGGRGYLASAVTKTLDKPGNAYYLLGVAEDQVGNRVAAKAALVKAQSYPESKGNATTYLKNFK
jgi:hypothetical protein